MEVEHLAPVTWGSLEVFLLSRNTKKETVQLEKACHFYKGSKKRSQCFTTVARSPGIPLLFGVCLKEKPVSIVMNFHGDGKDSLTVHKAAKDKLINEQKYCNTIRIETADERQ